MKHRLGVSGSTILTDPAQFEDLFWEGIEHIEIGEFPDEAAFDLFLKHCKARRLSFGVHSPLLRNQSKYDLLQSVFFEPEQAWLQLETEMQRLRLLGAQYVLVHFPYFKAETDGDAQAQIAEGLQRISDLQAKYQLPVICEPKLGLDQSAAGIQYFHDSLLEMWTSIGVCLDLGDIAVAMGEQAMEVISKWNKVIKVVHLHNVEFTEDLKYWWIPIHPSHEMDGTHYPMEAMLRLLASSSPKTFVFEHTPHRVESAEFVREGYEWVKRIINES